MRTQRWPTCSSVAPVCSALASSAAEIADRTVAVGDGEGPLHDRFPVEAGGPIARRRRGGAAAYSDGRPHEVLGPDQLDALALQGGGRLFQELVGVLDVELDRRRPVEFGERVEHADALGDRPCQLDHDRLEHDELVWGAGDLAGQRVAVPDVGRTAPSPGIVLVDELEVDAPRIEAVVGDDEPQPPDQCRLAASACAKAANDVGHRAHGIGMGGLRHPHAVVLTRQGAEHQPDDGVGR